MQEARPSWHSALSRSLRSSEPLVTANRAQLGLAHQALTLLDSLRNRHRSGDSADSGNQLQRECPVGHSRDVESPARWIVAQPSGQGRSICLAHVHSPAVGDDQFINLCRHRKNKPDARYRRFLGNRNIDSPRYLADWHSRHIDPNTTINSAACKH